jgi:hypothetical protein
VTIEEVLDAVASLSRVLQPSSDRERSHHTKVLVQ